MDEEVFRKNMGLGNKIKVLSPEGEKEIELYPLGIEYLPDILYLQSAFGEAGGNESQITKILAREDIAKRMAKLVKTSLKESLPDKDDKYIDFIAMKNFLQLMTEIFRVNDLGVSGLDAVKKRLEQIKKVREGENTNSS